MKRNICIISAVLLILSVLTACTAKSKLTDTLWYAKGSIIGLEDETGCYDIHLAFNKDNTGHIEYLYENNDFKGCGQFEYSASNEYLTIISYEEKVLDKDTHTYPYYIENDVLTIEVDNKKMIFDKLSTTNKETETTERNTTETYHPLNTYAILRAEFERISSLIWDENGKNLLPFDVTSLYIDDSDSIIVVCIKDITDEKIQYFKEHVSDKDFIKFEEGYSILT